jgi:S1-C subfamily serine protease
MVLRPYSCGVSGTIVDLVLLLLIVLFAINGYRQGFLVGALSFLGFFGGAIIGLQLAPIAVGNMSDPVWRVIVSLVSVFGLALIGQATAAWAGNRLRLAINSQRGRRLDDVGGVVVSIVALLLVAWMIAVPLGSSTLPGFARAVRSSAILGTIDKAMPEGASALYDRLRASIAGSDFPDVFGGLTPTQVKDVPAPDPALARSRVVRSAARSVVKVLGTAPGCQRRIEGTGFVFSTEHVMTNAHVVAGTRGQLAVEVGGGRRNGRVVLYDPKRDLAVLYVPGLNAPPMKWAAGEADSGDNAIVVGYPLDGPYTPTAARVRDVRNVRGPNIYNNANVIREVYTIRAKVRSGNSGGPLLATDGTVLGVIFAAAVDDPNTGFALTVDEATPVAVAGATRTEAVSTGACT